MQMTPKPASALGLAFLRDLEDDYRAHGAAAIADMRRNEPQNYFRLVHSLRFEDTERKPSYDSATDPFGSSFPRRYGPFGLPFP